MLVYTQYTLTLPSMRATAPRQPSEATHFTPSSVGGGGGGGRSPSHTG